MGLKDFFYERNDCLGKNGKLFTVYKLRTMCLDAEKHLNEAKKNGIDGLGKPSNDFRITKIGKFLRKYWIDELPQLWNLFSGEIDLVGIRPKQNTSWEHYPPEHKERALKYNPGLMGVLYSEEPSEDFEGALKVESNYLDRRKKSPKPTQINYLLKIMYNILFKRVRSR